MGNKVDLLNEIYTRLNTATASGGTLYGVKRVRVGSREDSRKLNDFPIINIRLLGGEEKPIYQNRTFVDEMRIEICLIVPKLATPNNSLFNTTDLIGVIYWFEKLLNTLDKKTDGSVDLGFSNKSENLRGFTYEVEEFDGLIEITTTMTVPTIHFTLGGR